MTIKDGIKLSFGIYIGFATIYAVKTFIEGIMSGNNQETKTAKDQLRAQVKLTWALCFRNI